MYVNYRLYVVSGQRLHTLPLHKNQYVIQALPSCAGDIICNQSLRSSDSFTTEQFILFTV